MELFKTSDTGRFLQSSSPERQQGLQHLQGSVPAGNAAMASSDRDQLTRRAAGRRKRGSTTALDVFY